MISIPAAQAAKGDLVIYRPPGQPDKAEQGVITGVSHTAVFVRYAGDTHAKATRPDDLEWVAPH